MTAIQDLINAAAAGATVTVPTGVYAVDAVNAPIVLKSDIALDLTGVTLQVTPSNAQFSIPLQVTGAVSNVTILNGTIVGDKTAHLPGGNAAVGPGGGLIGIGLGAANVKVQGTHLSNGYADGVILVGADNVELANLVSDSNNRNGLTITNSSGVHVHDNQFTNTGGSPPGDGIDVENDTDAQTTNGVLIERNTFSGNQGSDISFGSPGIYQNCSVPPGNSFTMKTKPIAVAGNAGSLGVSWWAYILNVTCSWMPFYKWWGYPTAWSN